MPNLNPILISSPVRRSGTTLIQRLLCSAPNCLIYGENCANEFQISSNLYLSKQLFFQINNEARDRLLQRVLDGEVNDWIADLMPRMQGYKEALKHASFSLFEHYQQFATEQGRPVWGMKMAEWHPASLQQSQNMFPESRFVYIQRNLRDCLRSAKRVNMVQSVDEVRQFCQIYQQNLNFVKMQYQHPKLMIDYQRLLEEPEAVIAELEAFTGARGIRASVLEQRINTFKSDVQRDPSGQGYLTPIDLTEEELRVVQAWER